MLRQHIKSLAMRIPEVRRLFEQRDMARSEVASLLASVKHLRAEAAELRTEAEKVKPLPEFAHPAYSHWGEDSVARYALSTISNGRYLDIGAYHPALHSNTMAFYEMGWSGVNVDPNAFMIAQYATFRPRDVSLCCAVGARPGRMKFFQFHEWASSNTISPEFADAIARGTDAGKPVESEVDVVTLLDLMERHFPDSAPDFVNVDVEGVDCDVILSNDWTRFRPKIMAIEDFAFHVDAIERSEIHAVMTSLGYELFSRCIYTSFYMERTFKHAM